MTAMGLSQPITARSTRTRFSIAPARARLQLLVSRQTSALPSSIPTNPLLPPKVKSSPHKVGTLLRSQDIPLISEEYLIDLFPNQQQPWVPSSVRLHEDPPPTRSPDRPSSIQLSHQRNEPNQLTSNHNRRRGASEEEAERHSAVPAACSLLGSRLKPPNHSIAQKMWTGPFVLRSPSRLLLTRIRRRGEQANTRPCYTLCEH